MDRYDDKAGKNTVILKVYKHEIYFQFSVICGSRKFFYLTITRSACYIKNDRKDPLGFSERRTLWQRKLVKR